MVSISFIKFQKHKWWAFKQMQLLPPQLATVKGQLFNKFLGTGSGFGFSLWPDFSTYALLVNWQTKSDMDTFFSDSAIFQTLESKAHHIETHRLEPLGAHGKWYGKNPFEKEAEPGQDKIAVITRARINTHKLPRFWQHVPKASKAIQAAKGLIFTKGIGEWPLIEQATFSIWENEAAMKQYAYQDDHKAIIQKVKQENWYKEELFSRFNYLGAITH